MVRNLDRLLGQHIALTSHPAITPYGGILEARNVTRRLKTKKYLIVIIQDEFVRFPVELFEKSIKEYLDERDCVLN